MGRFSQANLPTLTPITQDTSVSTLEKISRDGEVLSPTESDKIRELLTKEGRIPKSEDLPVFYTLLYNVIQKALEHEGNSSDILLLRSFPSKDQKDWREVITYSLKSREIALSGEMGPYSEANHSRSPRPLDTPQMVKQDVPDPIMPGQVLDVEMLRYVNIITITPWALTPEEADYRSFWLEEVLRQWKWYFIANGIQKVSWLRRLADVEDKTRPGEITHFGCPIELYVLTGRLLLRRIKTLQEIRFGNDSAT